jgi:hypothetical protein
MAKVKVNPILQGLSGGLGRDLMFRRLQDGRTILCLKPDFSKREFSERQLSHQQRFQEAAAYAKAAAKNQPIYAELAAGTMKNAYNIALSDWFHPPEILACELANWTGQAGDIVRIQAVDDVVVREMQVVFVDEQGEEIMRGEATLVDEIWWQFVASGSLEDAYQVIVTVEDLAGNVSEKSWDVLS